MKVSDGYAMADSRNLPKVDYMMLLQYMRENDSFNVAEIRGAKVLLSSRDAYVETAVGYVEVKRENAVCFIKGRVTPEHRVRTKMYSVVASINEAEETILDVKCEDCAASQGGCKHSICLIMWLIKRTEEPSVTSVRCYWTQPKLSAAVTQDKCILAKEMGKRLPATTSLPNSLKKAAFLQECRKRKMQDSLFSDYNNAVITLDSFRVFKLLLDYYTASSSQDELTDYTKLKIFVQNKLTNEVIDEIENQTRSQAHSQLWHILRQGRVTASKIYECTKCNTDGALVKSILGGYKIPETKAIKRGKRLEKEVVNEIMKKMNIEIIQCGFKLITPFVGASPDGLCVEHGFTVEIKCPSSNKTMESYVKDNVISAKCKAQIQLQMLAMNMKKALLCIADPDFERNKSYHEHWVYYDRLFAEKLVKEGEMFWEKFIFKKMLDIVHYDK